MPTHTLLKDGVTLRHGHGNANAPDPEKEQWHEAHVFHRTDPHAHTRERSWTSPNWSRNNWDISQDRRQELIERAQRLHDQAFNRAMGYWPRDTPDLKFDAPPAVTNNWPDPDEVDDTHEDDTYAEDISDGEGGDDDTAPAPLPAVSAETDMAVQINKAQQLAVLAAKAASSAAQIGKEVQTDHLALKSDFEKHRSIATDRVNAFVDRLDTTNGKIASVHERVERLEAAAANRIEIVLRNDSDEILKKVSGVQHKKFPLLVRFATKLHPSRRNIWMSGPAGAGKTHSWEELAKLLGTTFEYIGAVDSPYKLSGHYSGNGSYIATAFRRAYENGGVILLDEVDAGDPRALLEINAALANARAAFPDRLVDRHQNCIIGCAANTWGYGGDGNYVGRNKIDVAFLTRFVKMTWDYDEDLERLIAGGPDEWVDIVQTTRHAAFTKGGSAGMVISPRASQIGCELLREGFTPEEVVEATFGDFRKNSMWPEIGRVAEEFAKRPTFTLPTASTTSPTDDAIAARILDDRRNIDDGVDDDADDDIVVDMSRTRVFGGRR